MRIQSFSINEVRGLPEIVLNFVDPATGAARQRTVIAGSNGTGKTTILEVICGLLDLMQNVPNTQWWRTVKGQAALILVDLPTSPDKPTTIAVSEAGSPPTNGNEWLGVIQEAQLGKREFPNCVYFPSEGRELQPKAKGQIVDEPQSYRWVYRFSDSQKWAGSLESFLVAMDYRDLMAQREGRPGDEFTRFTTLTNRFLQGKQIRGVDSRFRVNVVAENGQSFGLEALSSGEKQILLMLGEIQRHLRPGGLLLIDEPEIHLHPRWQRLLVRALTELCTSANAQLILTTHSEEIASAVYEHELILLDAIFAQEPGV